MSDEEESAIIQQKLMSADEVYVYKIPPMKDSGGHRADDWNLAEPLQTCSLLVEQRGDALYLDFTHDGKLFAQSKMDLHGETGFKMNHWLEQVVDSSRYFALKIQGAGGREATIGFGFRDREQATDLRESLQHYEKAMRRENEAKSLSGSFSIPKMEDGTKIHVNRTGKSTIVKQPKEGGSGAVPLLKKPPPPAVDNGDQKKATEKINITMGNIDLDASPRNEDDSGSEGAVYTGDEEQWATEFNTK